MLNEVKHLAIAREILRCAQNDIVHHLTCDKAVVLSFIKTNLIAKISQKCQKFVAENGILLRVSDISGPF